MVSAARLCVICKGARMLCGLKTCPLMSRFSVRPKIETVLKDEFFGPATSVFIGRFGYPDVFTGPLAPMTDENVQVVDSPNKWFGTGYDSIIEMRSTLMRTKESTNVLSRDRTVESLQDIALASRAPDVELTLKGKPVYRVSFSDVNQPMGPSANLKSLDIAGNVKIGRHVDSIVSDDLTAREAGFMLYRKGEDVYKVSTILSSGALGMEQRRKLVPTRWSITASHDIVAKELLREVKDYPGVNEYMVFSSEYLDNHYEVLVMPGAWEFENFEAWAPGTPWSMNAKSTQIIEEHEPYGGRTKYADLQGGGYYASRLAVVEGLKSMRRQARVVVFREVYEGYVIPLGVWQVLENVRNAFRQPGMKFATKEEALRHIDSKLRIQLAEYEKQSVVLKRKTIADFFGG
jgi:hypothetical protein